MVGEQAVGLCVLEQEEALVWGEAGVEEDKGAVSAQGEEERRRDECRVCGAERDATGRSGRVEERGEGGGGAVELAPGVGGGAKPERGRWGAAVEQRGEPVAEGCHACSQSDAGRPSPGLRGTSQRGVSGR